MANTAGNTSSSLQKLQECDFISFQLISKGLDCEEKYNVDEAIRYYREGVALISEGLTLPFTANEWKHARPIHVRLQRNHTTFRNRIEELYQAHRKQQQEIEDRRSATQMEQQQSQPWYSRFKNWIWADEPTPSSSHANSNSNLSASPSPRHRRSLSGSDLSRQSDNTNTSIAHLRRAAEAPTSFSAAAASHSGTPAWKAPQPPQQQHQQQYAPTARSGSTPQKPQPAPPASAAVRPQSAAPAPAPAAARHDKAQQIANWKNAPELRGVEAKILDAILNEVMDTSPGVRWDDIAGLAQVKQSLWEAVILPNLRPELFTGLRAPPRGILLFGPPGNGKTMLAKAVSSESKASFFNISASSLTSKWHGDAEKLVRALFGAARYLQPSVVFIDEIDSVLCARSANEHEASRRLKTEFLVQMDGAGSNQNDRILIMGATNRPQELDEAVLRRFAKRVFIPLPDFESRATLIKNLLSKLQHNLRTRQLNQLADLTDGYSGSDLNALCKEVAMIPLREMGNRVLHASLDSIRPIELEDFVLAMQTIRPSTSQEQLQILERWAREFGSVQ